MGPAAADRGFDERRYGFTGLMDLLRACQREGLVRLERDRRGGLRVLQGPALQRPLAEPVEVVEQPSVINIPAETEAEIAGNAREMVDVEQLASEPMPVDTTAELLGRAKSKRTRGARTATPAPRASRKTGPRKTIRRPARAHKAPTVATSEDTES